MVLFVGKMGNFPRPVPIFNQLNEIRSSWWTFSQLRRTRGAVLFPLFRAPTLEFAFFARPHPGNGHCHPLPPIGGPHFRRPATAGRLPYPDARKQAVLRRKLLNFC